jgi:hypothetical protein
MHQVRLSSTCSPSPFRRTPPPLALRLRLHHATGAPRPRARALATLYWAIKNFCPFRGFTKYPKLNKCQTPPLPSPPTKLPS